MISILKDFSENKLTGDQDNKVNNGIFVRNQTNLDFLMKTENCKII